MWNVPQISAAGQVNMFIIFGKRAQELHSVVVRMSSYLNLRVVHAAQKEIRGLEVKVKNIKRQHHQHSMPWICDIPVFTCRPFGGMPLGRQLQRSQTSHCSIWRKATRRPLGGRPRRRVFADEAVKRRLRGWSMVKLRQFLKRTDVMDGRDLCMLDFISTEMNEMRTSSHWC